jgi:hypothetical protein
MFLHMPQPCQGHEGPRTAGAGSFSSTKIVAVPVSPLRTTHPAADVHRLAVAIRAATGIEALVWLTDIAGLARAEAVELMRWSARAMLDAARAGRDY